MDTLTTFVWQKCGVKVDSLKRVPKNQDKNQPHKKESFNGKDAVRILEHSDILMDFVFDELWNQQDPRRLDTKALYKQLWLNFRSLFALLKTPLPGETPTSKPSLADRQQRGREFQAAADLFYKTYMAVVCQQSAVTVYVHMIKDHFANYIREYGNLDYYSSQAIEHTHVITKYAFRWLTNKRVNDRVVQAFNFVCLFLWHRKQYPAAHRRHKHKLADVCEEL